MRKIAVRSTAVAVGAALAVVAVPALAADADWIKPVSDGATSLSTALTAVAGAIIGLGIVGAGIWAAMTQRIEWNKLWVFVVAGLLVSVGPTAASWWINTVGQGK